MFGRTFWGNPFFGPTCWGNGTNFTPSVTPSPDPFKAQSVRVGPDPFRAQSVRVGPDPFRALSQLKQ
jgi:hypothetical protein